MKLPRSQIVNLAMSIRALEDGDSSLLLSDVMMAARRLIMDRDGQVGVEVFDRVYESGDPTPGTCRRHDYRYGDAAACTCSEVTS